MNWLVMMNLSWFVIRFGWLVIAFSWLVMVDFGWLVMVDFGWLVMVNLDWFVVDLDWLVDLDRLDDFFGNVNFRLMDFLDILFLDDLLMMNVHWLN